MLMIIKIKLQFVFFFVTLSVVVDLHSSRSETQRTYFYILLVAIRFSTIEVSFTYGHVMVAFYVWCHQNYFVLKHFMRCSVVSIK